MFDRENEVIEENVVSASGPVEEVQQPEPQPVQPQQETPAERNHRALAEKIKRVERERDEAIQIAQKYSQVKSEHIPTQQEEPEYDPQIGAEELVEGKHIKDLNKEIRKIKKELSDYKKTSVAMTQETLLRAQYPDLEKVVNKDNLAALKDADPDLAEALGTSTSTKALITAYKQIKKLGIYAEDTYSNDREIAMKNANKPKPLASVSPQQGDSPLSHANAFANGLTEDLKKTLRKEMEEARKRR
jgi:hypothetical protein